MREPKKPKKVGIKPGELRELLAEARRASPRGCRPETGAGAVADTVTPVLVCPPPAIPPVTCSACGGVLPVEHVDGQHRDYGVVAMWSPSGLDRGTRFRAHSECCLSDD